MPIAINHNLAAANAARLLTSHYSNLNTSVERLASGMRINSAADDAAGLAIRELMRNDIAALNQGARNITDAISMIQVHDGAMAVIDEKLIRMKELAEQAATGTYNSVQREMIDNEFQAMADEIERIALATEFNGVKMLCNDPTNKLFDLAVPTFWYNFGQGGNAVATGNTEFMNPGAVKGPLDFRIRENLFIDARDIKGDPKIEYFAAYLLDGAGNPLDGEFKIRYTAATKTWEMVEDKNGLMPNATPIVHPFIDPNQYGGFTDANGNTLLMFATWQLGYNVYNEKGELFDATQQIVDQDVEFTLITHADYPMADPIANATYQIYDQNGGYPNAKIIDQGGTANNGVARQWFTVDLDGDGVADVRQTFTRAVDATVNAGNWRDGLRMANFTLELESKVKIHFGTGNDSAEDYYYIEAVDCTKKGLGIDALNVKTQDRAQRTLVELEDAIITKDNYRAYFGAMQNRLENSLSNITIQSENLQAAESRISDTDVATAMTEFVRQQILTNVSASMLAQANSLPQMVMQLIN